MATLQEITNQIKAITADGHACTCDEVAVKPNDLSHNGMGIPSLHEIATRHGKMPDGDELVSAHPKREGATYSLNTTADPEHILVVRTQRTVRTGDNQIDPVLDYASNVARNVARQAANVAFYAKPRK